MPSICGQIVYQNDITTKILGGVSLKPGMNLRSITGDTPFFRMLVEALDLQYLLTRMESIIPGREGTRPVDRVHPGGTEGRRTEVRNLRVLQGPGPRRDGRGKPRSRRPPPSPGADGCRSGARDTEPDREHRGPLRIAAVPVPGGPEDSFLHLPYGARDREGGIHHPEMPGKGDVRAEIA